MSKKWAKHFMNENRNNQYRNEQLQIYMDLREKRPESRLLMEYEIKYKYDDEERITIADIVDLTKKEIIRINGGVHMSSDRRILKDEIQKEGLEASGWIVTDIDV